MPSASRRPLLAFATTALTAVATVRAATQEAAPAVVFTEIAPEASGISWIHESGRSPERYLPETIGPGAAFFDFDNDGWLDLFLVNSGTCDFYGPAQPPRHALYRNDGDGTFTDVAEKAGVAGGVGFGMGASAGDFDGDGWQDLLVTAYGSGTTLYRNNRDSTFTDVTERAGLAAPGWCTSAAWFDYDRDGRLDLFVASFVQFDKSSRLLCFDPKLDRNYYCVPRNFRPTASRLYHNEGDGTFTDASAGSGIARSLGKAFGVVATDVNDDRLPDLFVACDTVANLLFVNLGGGRFEEDAVVAGVAYNPSGSSRSGMGVDAADYDGDGRQDLLVANIDHEITALYRNAGNLTFLEQRGEIATRTRMLSGWGSKFLDYDDDGDPDLFLAHGHPDDGIEQRSPGVTYREPLLLFENDGGTFRDVSTRSGPAFARALSARGTAAGDYDNDGDPDLVVSDNDGAPLLLRNDGGNRNHWVGVRLVATKSNPAAEGAILTWEAGGKRFRRLKIAGGSYLSSHDPREVLGLGAATALDRFEVAWPSGLVEAFRGLPLSAYTTVTEGRGEKPAPAELPASPSR